LGRTQAGGPLPSLTTGAAAPAVAAAPATITPTRRFVAVGADMIDIAKTASGYVAVGGVIPNRALSWTSTDGVSWTQSRPATALRYSIMLSVAVKGSRIVAV